MPRSDKYILRDAHKHVERGKYQKSIEIFDKYLALKRNSNIYRYIKTINKIALVFENISLSICLDFYRKGLNRLNKEDLGACYFSREVTTITEQIFRLSQKDGLCNELTKFIKSILKEKNPIQKEIPITNNELIKTLQKIYIKRGKETDILLYCKQYLQDKILKENQICLSSVKIITEIMLTQNRFSEWLIYFFHIFDNIRRFICPNEWLFKTILLLSRLDNFYLEKHKKMNELLDGHKRLLNEKLSFNKIVFLLFEAYQMLKIKEKLYIYCLDNKILAINKDNLIESIKNRILKDIGWLENLIELLQKKKNEYFYHS